MASPPRSPDNDRADGDDNEQNEQPAASTSKHPENGAQPALPDTWQAIFSTHHNTYYFYNTVTNETTWENPFQAGPSASASPPTTPPQPDSATDTPPTHTPAYSALQQAALTQGIDPSLAHLDPSLLATVTAGSIPGANPSFTAKFNARTGTFTRNDARDPSHLSEYERAKRMSEFYFDVAAWEDERDAGTSKAEEEGKKRKRPTKKDLVCDLTV
jgi:hypothetical protein